MLLQVEQSYCKEPNFVTEEFSILAHSILNSYNLDKPSSYREALRCFFILTETMNNLFEEVD